MLERRTCGSNSTYHLNDDVGVHGEMIEAAGWEHTRCGSSGSELGHRESDEHDEHSGDRPLRVKE